MSDWIEDLVGGIVLMFRVAVGLAILTPILIGVIIYLLATR